MRSIIVAVSLVGCSAAWLDAQLPAERLSLIRLVRSGARSGAEPNPAVPYRASQPQLDVIGLKSLTGPAQTWMVEAHGSFGSLEALDRALSQVPGSANPVDTVFDEVLTGSSSLIGVIRPGLSYRPDEAVRLLPGARYLQISVYRTRPGADIDFAELMRMRKAGLDAVNLDKPELGYQIISGGVSGMYVFISPIASLQSMDQGLTRTPVYADAAAHAAAKGGRQIISEAEITREHLLFRVEPQFSYVSEAFAAADPDFWRPAASR